MIFHAQRISKLVRERLNCGGAGGSVHSVFDRTVNMLGHGRQGATVWVSIHAPDVAVHPHAVIVDRVRAGAAAADGVAGAREAAPGLLGAFVGERVRLGPTEIVLGHGRATIILEGAEVWNPWPPVAGLTRQTEALQAAGVIRDWLEGEEITSPFLRATPGVGSAGRAVGRRCAAIRHDLAAAWRLGDADRAALAMARAVGLGAGLTPSGDDFLTGFLGATRLSEYGNGLRRRLYPHLRIDESMTTLPSFFMLEGALAGFFPEPLSCLLGALADKDHSQFLHSAGRLAGLGATSGQDMLAGVICCLEATAAAGDLI
jgi:hypothetical protein